MDGDFRVDIGEIKRNIEAAEVVALYFPLFRKTLLLDTRSNSVDGPMIKLVPMVNSIEDRFKSLKRLRPRFPMPESITIIPWPKYVTGLKTLGVWDKIVQRFVDLGDMDAVRTCSQAFNALLRWEMQERVHAIRGKQYQTLWQRQK